jgi:hypothetical protein
MVLTPRGINFTLACRFWSCCLHRKLMLKRKLSGYVHRALQEKITKPDTSQDTSWKWLQRAQGPKYEAGKLQGPRQKMLKLARQGTLSKPWRRWRQGPTCIREQVNNWSRSIGERDGAEPGRNGSVPVGPDRSAWPVSSPVCAPLCPRCSSIYCLCLRRPPHPSIHQRAAETKEKHREEADGRRKSSRCLGDGLGHA